MHFGKYKALVMQDIIIIIIITQPLNSLCHIPAPKPPVSPLAHSPTTTFNTVN